jgi:acyl-coenzyme A synthetase/AMP-(fatty) acid ligase
VTYSASRIWRVFSGVGSSITPQLDIYVPPLLTDSDANRESAPRLSEKDGGGLALPQDETVNVGELARAAAIRYAARTALVLRENGWERRVSFAELGALVDRFAAGLETLHHASPMRVLVLAPPTLEIFALALATLRTGNTLVTVDGRMDTGRLRHALGDADADVIIGTPRLMRWWPFVRALRRAARFTAAGSITGARPLSDLLQSGELRPAPIEPIDRRVAVISYSSGTTGGPKRVVRTHSVLWAQHRALVAAFPLPDSDVNLPGFPLAVLHNVCRGITTILPSADLRSMATADASTIVRAIRDYRVTSISGAPAFIARIAADLLAHGDTAKGVRRVVVGGGPVSGRLARDILTAFPFADACAIYGSTEAEPIATAPLRRIVSADLTAAGYLAGWPTGEVEVRIDGAGTGELLVRGPNVVPSGTDHGWHRTGDVCRMDERGNLWLLGRVGAEVRRNGVTVHPFVAEARVSDESGVVAAALVAHRRAPEGELVVQIERGANQQTVIEAARAALVAVGLTGVPVRTIDAMPMDARHSSKVDRPALIRRLERGRQ